MRWHDQFVPDPLMYALGVVVLEVLVGPVEDVVRPGDPRLTGIDPSSEFLTNDGAAETKPGVGTLWAALLAFLQSGRRR